MFYADNVQSLEDARHRQQQKILSIFGLCSFYDAYIA